jgi:Protein of unknown function (DUF3592)
MPTFHYEGMTSSGEEVVDVIEADDSKIARKLLAASGLFVTKLTASAVDSPNGNESEPANGPTFYVTKNPWAHGLVCFLGLAFTIIGVGSLLWVSHWREHGERTVVEVVRTQNGEGVYRYKAAGLTIEMPRFVKGVQRDRGGWSSYAFGMRLDALYDPNEPERVVLERELDNFRLAGLIFLPVGIVCLLAGMAGFAVILRQPGKTRNS